METQRDILTKIAEGALSPEEGAARLDELGGEPKAPAAVAAGEVRRVRVVGDFRTAKIIGDPEVLEATAEGPHTAHREGDTIVFNAELSDEEMGKWKFRKGPGARVSIGLGSKPVPLQVRMNPALALEVRIDAGSASIRDVRGPISGEIDAGIFRIEGFASPFQLEVDAGSVHASGVLDTGHSRIRCDAGTVKIRLHKGSNVRVKAHADVGRISVRRRGDEYRGFKIGSNEHEVVYGEGAATLDIEGGIGAISVEGDE